MRQAGKIHVGFNIMVAIPCSVQKHGKSAYIKEFVNGAVDFWVGALPILKG